MRLFAARLAKGSSVAVFVLVTNMGYQNVYKNGAAPLVVKAIITPTSSKTKMIGVSHHFLLLNKKSMNSRMIPTLPEIASCSNDVFFLVFVNCFFGVGAVRMLLGVRVKVLNVFIWRQRFGSFCDVFVGLIQNIGLSRASEELESEQIDLEKTK